MREATAGAASAGEGDDAPPFGDEAPAMSQPNKFRADLTRAMMAAAESARDETVARLQAEAKAASQQIQELSATEAASLRRQADEDVASIREWSKAEVTRVREETDQRIAERKVRLEQEIEQHAAQIERRIEKVQGRVAAFEAEMASFFQRLLAEEDPTRFASMAEHLPQPDGLDDDFMTSTVATAAPASPPASPARAAEAWPAPRQEAAPEPPGRDAWPSNDTAPAPSSMSAMAAIEEAARAAEGTDPVEAPGSHFQPEAVAEEAPAPDPRLSIFGGGRADFAAAEAEAAAAVGTSDMTEEIPTIADDALAARLAGLVPGSSQDTSAPVPREAVTTQVVVTGLVSVASIASFKRHLGRVPGVQSVGVSSGPEGEFIFAAHHGPEVVLRDAIPSLPGFKARVTGEKDSTVEVAAHDPESGA